MKTIKTPLEQLKEHLYGLKTQEVVNVLRGLSFDIRYNVYGHIMYDEEEIEDRDLLGIIEEDLNGLTENEISNVLSQLNVVVN